MLETDARDRVIVALDCDRERALELAHELSGHAAWLKVGMTLYYAEGPVSIIVMATLVGWMVAECVGLAPDDFAPLGLSPLALTLLRVVMSFVGVFGFSVMFNSPVKMAAAAGLIGAVSNTLRLTLVDAPTMIPFLGLSTGMPPEAAAFIGALVSGLLASLAEVKLTYPRIALTVPSIVIMVPGLYLYRSMYYMCTFDTVNMLGWFVRAVLIVAFLPVGLGVARTLTDPRWRHTS